MIIDVIDTLQSILINSVTSGEITHVEKHNIYTAVSVPEYAPQQNYIMIDDAGEEYTHPGVGNSQERLYKLTLDVVSYVVNIQTALTECSQLWEQVREVIQADKNRIESGLVFGYSVEAFNLFDEGGDLFYKGRRAIISYRGEMDIEVVDY